MISKSTRLAMSAGLLSLSFACVAVAEDPKNETLVIDLENPSGIVVHPETGNVYTASRFGVHRYEPATHKALLEVAGYATGVYGKGPKYNIGPLGLGILDKDHIVVGDGSRPDGEELVRVYKLDSKRKKEDEAAHTLGPIKPGEDSPKGEGNFYGIAINDKAIFVTCNGNDTKGWVAKADIVDGKPGELKPFIATKEHTNVDAPVAITFTPDGSQLVVGQMGEMNVPGDSLITFYDPNTGEMKKNLKTGLSDIAGLAYSPKTGKLYAVDFSWAATENGGLFEVVIEGDKVTTNKIMSLDKPAALAFGKEGQLYVAVFGTEPPAKTESPGSLIEIEPGL